MEKLAISAAALFLAFGSAIAQPVRVPGNQSLSLDQQNQLSELITDQTPQPLTNVNFSVAPGVVVPTNVALRQLPVEAEMITSTLQGYSYLAVEELEVSLCRWHAHCLTYFAGIVSPAAGVIARGVNLPARSSRPASQDRSPLPAKFHTCPTRLPTR